MKALVIDKNPTCQEVHEYCFSRLGIETRPIYNSSERFDFAFIHFDGGGSFELAEKIRREQPSCLLLVYNSMLVKDAAPDSINGEFQRKLRTHFDELLYAFEVPKQIEDLVKRKAGS